MEESNHKCGGHCCKQFIFPFSPTELESLKKSLSEPEFERYFIMDSGEKRQNNFDEKEVNKIVDMLIFIETSHYSPNEERDIIDGLPPTHKYTCKHYDKETTLCTNYENRPDMCKIYPRSTGCTYKACQGSCSIKKTKRK